MIQVNGFYTNPNKPLDGGAFLKRFADAAAFVRWMEESINEGGVVVITRIAHEGL